MGDVSKDNLSQEHETGKEDNYLQPGFTRNAEYCHAEKCVCFLMMKETDTFKCMCVYIIQITSSFDLKFFLNIKQVSNTSNTSITHQTNQNQNQKQHEFNAKPDEI